MNQFPTDIRRYKRHKLSKCYLCGWVNNPQGSAEETTIRPLKIVTSNNVLLTVSACKSCIDKFDKQVWCVRCGIKKGAQIHYRTIERRRLEDDTKLCLVILPLCQNCAIMWDKIKEDSLNIPKEVCDSCDQRFSCYTGTNEPKWKRFVSKKALKKARHKYTMK